MEQIRENGEVGQRLPAQPGAPISERKLQANRENAKRSTGPKTARGKGFSRFNALKHGILAKAAIIPSGAGKEDAKEFNRLLRGLREDYQPEGTRQELLVEEILLCYWQKKRVLRYEAGEIHDNRERVRAEYEEREDDETSISLEQRQLASWLQRAVRAVQRYGAIPESLKSKLSSFDAVPGFAEFKAWLEEASWPFLEADPNDPAAQSSVRILLLHHLRAYLAPLKAAIEQEDHMLDTLHAMVSIPVGSPLENILRYDGAIERRLQRAEWMLLFLKSQDRTKLGPGPDQEEMRNEAKN